MCTKENYEIKLISKVDASLILLKYHYLKDISKGFKSGINYGLFLNNELVGVAIFTGFPVPELVKGMFGLERTDQKGFFEISRLCIIPEVQKNEHNITSWFLSRCIKQIRKDEKVRAILTYADSDFHSGIVYAACNFTYYGLSDKKQDFYFELLDDNGNTYYQKHSRGKTKGIKGEWRDRSRKHRFVKVYDKSLSIKWVVQKWKK